MSAIISNFLAFVQLFLLVFVGISALAESNHPQYTSLKDYERHYSSMPRSSRTSAMILEILRYNLERWQKLPDNLGERHATINLASGRLEVWENGLLISVHKGEIPQGRTDLLPFVGTRLTDAQAVALLKALKLPTAITTDRLYAVYFTAWFDELRRFQISSDIFGLDKSEK